MQNVQKKQQTIAPSHYWPSLRQSVWLHEHEKSQMLTGEAFHLCSWTWSPSWLAGAIWRRRCTQVHIQPGDITCAWRRLSVATAAAGHISLMFICLCKLAATSRELKGKSAGHRFFLCCPSIPLFLSAIVRLSPHLSLSLLTPTPSPSSVQS